MLATKQSTTRGAPVNPPNHQHPTYLNIKAWRQQPYIPMLRENLPDELLDLPQFVDFQLEWTSTRKENGAVADKWQKRPTSPHTGLFCSHSQPKHWGAFDDAARRYQSDRRQDGLGFVVAHEAAIVGVDFDHCILLDGSIRAWVLELIKRFDSYAETSPSGDGIHMLVHTSLRLPKGVRDDARGIEVYPANRFLTLTGLRGKSRPRAIRDATDWLTEFYQEYAAPDPVETQRIYRSLDTAGAPDAYDLIEDQRVITRALTARNGAKFHKLFDRGDTSDYQSGGHSSADYALLEMLAFWTNRDAVQMKRLFERSALVRPKWFDRHSADGRSYGDLSIANLLETLRQEDAQRAAEETK